MEKCKNNIKVTLFIILIVLTLLMFSSIVVVADTSARGAGGDAGSDTTVNKLSCRDPSTCGEIDLVWASLTNKIV